VAFPVAVGIDFGTSKSCAAILQNGVPVVVTDPRGRRTEPSVVMVDPQGQLHVGWDAVDSPLKYRSQSFTISSVKRLMGTYGERQWGRLKTFPQEISALLIALLKARTETCCQSEISSAVIAVPAHYDLHQRWATIQAAEIAGFRAVRLVNEATAAVLAYKHQSAVAESVLVFDFGAGTLDVSVVEWGDGVAEVKASAGDDQLGGDDFDDLLVKSAIANLNKQNGNVKLDEFQMLVLREAARQAKVQLTSASEANIFIPGFVSTSRGHVDLNHRITRAEFEEMSSPLFDRAESVLRRALLDSRLLHARPSKLLLIGGTSRIPYVRDMVKQAVGLEPITGLDSESGVCEGACILSGVFSGTFRDLVLLDVTPATYSVGLKDDTASVLIIRNTTIPTSKIALFTTTENNQTELTVRIYQGERAKTSQNNFVGQLQLTGLQAAAAGTPQIDVCFEIDAHGTLRASATDRTTGRQVTSVLDSPYKLNPAQMKLLQRKVQHHIATVREAETSRKSLELQAAERARATKLSQIIAEFLQEFGEQVPTSCRSLLRSGGLLVEDYLSRDASARDLGVLAASVSETLVNAGKLLLLDQLAALATPIAEWGEANADKRIRADIVVAVSQLDGILRPKIEQLSHLISNLGAEALFSQLSTSSTTLDSSSIFILVQFLNFVPSRAHLDTLGTASRDLLRLLVLAQLASPHRQKSGVLGALARQEFSGSECLFLSEYLPSLLEGEARTAVLDCLRSAPLGSWRRAWRESKYEPSFLDGHPIAEHEIRREIIAALAEGGPADLQLLAVADLRRIGVHDSFEALARIIRGQLHPKAKCCLLPLMVNCDVQNAIPLLFEMIGKDSQEVAAIAVSNLLAREKDVPTDLVPVLRIVDRFIREGQRPSWAERLKLWRLRRRHKEICSLVEYLTQARTKAAAN
jgi:molecular chaperone DnaK